MVLYPIEINLGTKLSTKSDGEPNQLFALRQPGQYSDMAPTVTVAWHYSVLGDIAPGSRSGQALTPNRWQQKVVLSQSTTVNNTVLPN